MNSIAQLQYYPYTPYMNTLIARALILLGLLTPAFALAESSADIPAEGPSSCSAIITRSLVVGSSGNDVVALQKFLQSRGYLSLTATRFGYGYFGQLTQGAVKRFQVANGIQPADGSVLVNGDTAIKINTLYCAASSTGISTVPGCLAGQIYSSVTGGDCGCTSGAFYSSLTGNACSVTPSTSSVCPAGQELHGGVCVQPTLVCTTGYVVKDNTCVSTVPFVPGCISYVGYSSTTGAPCNTALSGTGLVTKFVAGNKSAYAAGEKITVTLKGVEQFDTSPGEPSEGFNVQGSIRASNTSYAIQAFNASYNPQTGYWDMPVVMPADSSKSYVFEAALYCSNGQLACGKRYPGGIQVSSSFTFSVSGSGKSQVTVTSPDGGESYQAGQAVQMPLKWTADCSFPLGFQLGLIKGTDLIQQLNTTLTPQGICSSGQKAVPYYTTWPLPSTLTPGNDYRIWVMGNDGNGGIGDTSDGTFTIAYTPSNRSMIVSLGTATATLQPGSGGQPDSALYVIPFRITAGDDDVYIGKNVTRAASPTGSNNGVTFDLTQTSGSNAVMVDTTNIGWNTDDLGDTPTALKVSAGTARAFLLNVHLIAAGGGYAGVRMTGINYSPTSAIGSTYYTNLDGFKTSDVYLRPGSTASPTQGSLSFSQSSFSATYTQGSPLPSTDSNSPYVFTHTPYSQSLTFKNTSNVNVTYTISVPNQPRWLNTGYATDPLTAGPGVVTGIGAYLDPATVAGSPGTYTTNIIISGNFTGSPKTIPVTLMVVAAPTTPAPTVSLTASPSTITLGQSSTLVLASTNALSCSVSNIGTADYKNGDGNFVVTPKVTTTYVATCTGSSGTTASSQTTVTVNTPIVNGPSVTFSANATTATVGQVIKLNWSAPDATSCTASNATGYAPWSGPIQLPDASGNPAPWTTGSFSFAIQKLPETLTITCTNANGSTQNSVTINPAVLGAEKFIFSAYLLLSSSGSEVAELQKLLTTQGYYHDDITGYFGPLTEGAVKQFQTAHGIEATGTVGPTTRAVLNQ